MIQGELQNRLGLRQWRTGGQVSEFHGNSRGMSHWRHTAARSPDNILQSTPFDSRSGTDSCESSRIDRRLLPGCGRELRSLVGTEWISPGDGVHGPGRARDGGRRSSRRRLSRAAPVPHQRIGGVSHDVHRAAPSPTPHDDCADRRRERAGAGLDAGRGFRSPPAQTRRSG